MTATGNMFRLLTADEIECRVAQSNDKGLSLLLYKDARCDMNILDETVGSLNWTREHKRDNANCIVSIYDPSKNTWVSKEDTGTESNTEAEKGLASDSFKRACFNWGIGRELYTAPFIWIPISSYSTYERNGKKVCKDKFRVESIGYNDRREINALRIVNVSTHTAVFVMGDEQARAKCEAPKKGNSEPLTGAVPPESNDIKSMAVFCDSCQKEIVPVTNGGTLYGVADIVRISKEQYHGCFCWNCMKRLKAKKATTNGGY